MNIEYVMAAVLFVSAYALALKLFYSPPPPYANSGERILQLVATGMMAGTLATLTTLMSLIAFTNSQ